MSCSKKQDDAFLQLMTEYQPRLYAYILSLCGNTDDANDIMQDVNIILWRESESFQLGTSFKAWAFRVAHFQVMTHRQKRMRERLVFDVELVEILEDEARRLDEQHDERRELLAECLDKLAPTLLRVVGYRYLDGLSVTDISSRIDRSANAVSQLLYRGRQRLIDCVTRRAQSVS